MRDWVALLREGAPGSGDLARTTPAYLRYHGCPGTAAHVARVASAARAVALRFDLPPHQAEAAGWLHDVSAVIPAADRVEAARALAIPVLAEEAAFPMIIHQKLSAWMGAALFGVTDAAVLDAVSCHTTLRQDATPLAMAVFVADKIAWDQPGEPPYLGVLLAALDRSLEHAALAYLAYLWQRRATLKVIHPWLAAAYAQLSERLAGP